MGKNFTLLLLVFSGVAVEAGWRFDTLRNDQYVPEKCRQVVINNFAQQVTFFTLSTNGGKSKGFTYEHPVKRNVAGEIWQELHQSNHSRKKGKNKGGEFDYYLQLVAQEAPVLDFDLHSEGEVLEILGRFYLAEILEGSDFFITGSIAYHDPGPHNRRIGELDFIVAHEQSCEIYAVGEAKLNPRKIRHAKSQLQRFANFLSSQASNNDLFDFMTIESMAESLLAN